MTATTSDNIWPLVLPFCDLDTLIALNSCSKSLKNLISSADESTVKNAVQKRVPWMSYDGNKSRLPTEQITWLRCARIVVARSRQAETPSWEKDLDLLSISKQWGFKHNSIPTERVAKELPWYYEPFYKTESDEPYGEVDCYKWCVTLHPANVVKPDVKEVTVDGEVKEYKKQGDLGVVTVEKEGETKTYISTTSTFTDPLPKDSSVVFIPDSNKCLVWIKHSTSFFLVLMDPSNSHPDILIAAIPIKTFKDIENPHLSATFYDGILHVGLDTLLIPLWVDLNNTWEREKLPKNFPIPVTQVSTAIKRHWNLLGFSIGKFKTVPFCSFLDEKVKDLKIQPIKYIRGTRPQYMSFEQFKNYMFLDFASGYTWISGGNISAPIMGFGQDIKPLQYMVHTMRAAAFANAWHAQLEKTPLTLDNPINCFNEMSTDWDWSFEGQKRMWNQKMWYVRGKTLFSVTKEKTQSNKHFKKTEEVLRSVKKRKRGE